MNALVKLHETTQATDHDVEVLQRLETFEVECWRNPLSSFSDVHVMKSGLTVTGVIERALTVKAIRRYAKVWVSSAPGEPATEVARDQWDSVRLKAGCYVAIRCVPGGGGGRKNFLAVLLSLLVMVAAFYFAPVVAAGIGITSGAGTSMVFSALSTIGKALVSALIPPPKISSSNGQIGTERNYALTGTQNRVAPFQAVPRAYGRMRYFPPLASAPYNEIVGTQDVYLRMLFDFGPGPLKISDIRVGDTAIENFVGVEIEVGHTGDLSGNACPAGTYYAGFPNDRQLTLYPNSIQQQSESVRFIRETEVTRAFNQRVDQGIVVITFPRGLIEFSNAQSNPGGRGPWTTAMQCWFREIGTSTWTPMIPMSEYAIVTPQENYSLRLLDQTAGGYAYYTVAANWDENAYLAANPDVAANYNPAGVTHRGFHHYAKIGCMEGRAHAFLNNGTTGDGAGGKVDAEGAVFPIEEMLDRQFYYTFKTPKLDNAKNYEFRLRRPFGQQTPGESKVTTVDDTYLSGVQSLKAGSPVRDVAGHAIMALRIKSSDQLNGTLQNLSAKVESALPIWSGASWSSPALTRNPAWAALDVLRGQANARPLADSRLDLPAWLAFSQWCDGANSNGNPRAMFDGVFDAKTTVAEALRQILAPQRASFVMKDGRYSVIWDEAKTTPVQLFTPKNSTGFSSSKSYTTPPHALKIRFNNELKNYSEDEVTVYADGYSDVNATLFEQLEAFGIVRAEQAHWFGRYMMAANLLRPETYTLEVDVEGMVCRRGDLVRVQHDVPRWGAAAGRVRSVQVSAGDVTSVTLDDCVLLEPGKAYALRGRLSSGALVLMPVAVAVSQTETFTLTLSPAVPESSCVAAGDLVAFGETAKETALLLVRSIRRKDDLHATLELVDYSPDIFTSDTEAIPEFDTQSTWQGAGVTQSPPVPVIDTIVSDETAMFQTTSGWLEAFEVRLLEDSAVDQGSVRPDDTIELRYKPARSNDFIDGGETTLLSGSGANWYSPIKKFVGNPKILRVSDFVRTNDEFDIEVRRVTASGNASAWTQTVRHLIVGRSTPPARVAGAQAIVRPDSVLLFWEPSIERDIDGYELRVGATWEVGAAVEKSPTTQTTQYTLSPQQAGPYTYFLRALDTFGLYSSSDALIQFVISAPTAPTVSYTFEGANVVLTWQDCETSHRITTYKVQRGNEVALETRTTSIQFPVNWQGAKQFSIWAIDAAGNESPVSNVSVSVSGAGAPTSFTHSFVGDAFQLSWVQPAAGSIPISQYEIRHSGAGWDDATFVGRAQSTNFVTTANWSGSRTFRLRAVDIAGNYGGETTRTAIINSPASVALTGSLSAGQYELTWSAPSSLLPIREYEIRHGANWSGGTLVSTVQALNWSGSVGWSGARTFWIVARTTTGLESTPAQLVLSVTAPSAPLLSSVFVAGTLSLSWTVPSSALPIARYEVRYGGSDWASATFVTFADQTNLQAIVSWSGSRLYRVAAIDTAGNEGAAGVLSVSVVSPSAPLNLASDIVDNNVLLKWSPPTLHSLPIDYYEVRVGSSWVGATSLGRKDGTFTSHFQTASGNYTYWVAAYDTAGNEGTPTGLTATVNQPPDYVLKASFNSTFSGTKTNAEVNGGCLFMPLVTGQTFSEHFTTESWSSPQDQINAGFPIYIQPTTTNDAIYVETYDYGTSIPSANITVTPTFETIAGSIALSGRIEVSSDGSSWADVTNPGWTGFASNFRYIRFTVKASGSTRAAVGKMASLNVRIDLKSVSDSGVVTCNAGDSGGTTVTFARTFIDVDSITVTPRSTTACYAVVDFVDAPNPTSFKILVFDINGNRVTKDVGWSAQGV